MGLVLLLSGAALVALPGALRPVARRLPPGEWARLCGWLLAAGGAVVELASVLYASPTVLRAAGVPVLASVCEKMLGPLVPGGATAGWTAAAAAVTMPILAAVGVRRARASQRVLRVEPWLGSHHSFGGREVVVLPTDQPLALSVDGPQQQVIVSDGLTARLTPAELDAVLRHEMAHLAHHHQRLLVLAAALDHGLAFFAPVRLSTRALRAALERWADEDAAAGARGGRTAVRRALLELTTMATAPGVAAFSPAEALIERLDALADAAPPAPGAARRAALYGPATVLGATTVVALGAWTSNARMLVTMAGRCLM